MKQLWQWIMGATLYEYTLSLPFWKVSALVALALWWLVLGGVR